MFKSLKVGTRLILGFLVVCLMGAIVAGIGIRNMGKINDEAERMYKLELLGLSHIKEANVNLMDLGRSLRSALIASSDQDRQKSVDRLKTNRELMRSYLDKARPLYHSAQGQAMFAELENQLREFDPMIAEVLQKSATEELQQKRDLVEYVFTTLAPKSAVVDQKMTELARLKEANAQEAAVRNAGLYSSSRAFMIVLVVCSGLVGMALGALITRNLTRQLGGEPGYAAAIAERIASGDLTVEVDLRRDDKSSLLFAMKSMRDSLVNVVGQVRSGTDSIASASGQIASGNLDLSSRTEEQASSLEETASSMEELTSTVKQNADNARQANHLAMSASDVAGKGGEVIEQVVETMGSINTSAHKIVDIISVIDGIAFQTNILALNAAVEAARAGEQGRGFAVVAGEVRNLAQRSASAAKEIKLLIDTSVENVETGARLVDQAGTTMKDIMESVRRVTDIMGEITAASQEQTAGIEQINQAITQMDDVTQQNASLVEEAAAASEALQDQANKLAAVVSIFKVEGSQQAHSTVAPAKTARVSAPKPRAAALPAKAPARVTRAPSAATASADWEEF
jgi:methyl-accepting chemotaxis protein